MILPLVLWAAAADAFLAPSPIRKVPSRCATEAPELDDADLSALSTAATRMQLERRFSRSVTRRRRVYLPYADAARWARGLGLSTEAEWDEWVGLGEGKNAYVPSRPADYYGGRGEWVSWAHYLVGGGDADAAPAPPPEVLPQSYFADLDYAGDAVPWDLRGRPQPAVRKAWAAGAFRNCRMILDCGCGSARRLPSRRPPDAVNAPRPRRRRRQRELPREPRPRRHRLRPVAVGRRRRARAGRGAAVRRLRRRRGRVRALRGRVVRGPLRLAGLRAGRGDRRLSRGAGLGAAALLRPV